MEWINLTKDTMPDSLTLVWIERKNGDTYIGVRDSEPYSIDKPPHLDCFWIAKPKKINAKPKRYTGFGLNWSFSDRTVLRWAKIERPKVTPINSKL